MRAAKLTQALHTFLFAVAGSDAFAGEPAERALFELAPEGTLVWVEAPGLADLARQGLDHPLARAILDAPALQGFWKSRDFDPRAKLAALDGFLGRSVLASAASMAENGAALAWSYRQAAPRFTLFLRGRSAEEQEELFESILELVGREAGEEPGRQASSSVTRWTVGELEIVLTGATALIGNDRQDLDLALGALTDSKQRGLGARADFLSARPAQVGLAFAWADLQRLEELAKLGPDGGKDFAGLRGMIADPGALGLLGAGFASLGTARAMTLTLATRDEDLEFRLAALGVEPKGARKLLPDLARAPAPMFQLEGAVLDALVYRDWAAFLRERAELFAPERLPAFAEAQSNLALLFGGGDVTEDVLPKVSPWMRIVARDVQFAPGRRPELPLPAAAGLVRLVEPERTGELFVSAFQTAVGFANVERAQRGKMPFTLSLERLGDTQLTSARAIAPAKGEGIDATYNLEPAIAIVGDVLVIGTHRALVAELAGELLHAKDSQPRMGEFLYLDGPRLASVVRANRAHLAMQAVLNEGKTRERAEADLDGLEGLLSLLASLRLELQPEASRIELTGRLDVVAPRG